MAEPVLYSFRRCPYAMRARMALLVSGARCELREVKLSDKPAALLQASAKATVPVLVLGNGRVIDESLDIMRWALAARDPEHWLDGDDRTLLETNDGAFKHHLDRYKYPGRHDSDAIDHRAAGLTLLGGLERRLRSSAWLCGDTRSLSDAAIMPFVRQFAAVDPAWFAVQPMASLRRWLDRQTASPLFDAAMRRHPLWRPGQAPVPLDAWTDRAAIG